MVLDMAIYVKAVDVMMTPRYIDLKQFDVFRLDGFHTMCIFIAAIGSRFADAGLRDIVIFLMNLRQIFLMNLPLAKCLNESIRKTQLES